MNSNEEKRRTIREGYSEIAKSRNHCCSPGYSCGCTSQDITEATLRSGYTIEDLTSTPSEANMGLGCGNPVAIASLKKGETVLDLGSGGGFDCFLARRQVGEAGYVIGVDMTPDMISLARKNAEKSGYTNVDFRLGEIEHLPVENNTADIIISNCVINLSVDKQQVYKEAYRVLKPGGRVSISDVAAIADLPEYIKEDLSFISSCIGGAEHIDTIRTMLEKAGFKDIRITEKENSKEMLSAWAPDAGLENLVASFIIEAVK